MGPRAEHLAPPDVDVRLLDPGLRRALSCLAPGNADRVARHLVAVGEALAGDPPVAWAHAKAARALAGRVGAVRELAGLAAYRAGEFADARAELRAARRMSGDARHLAVLADCERALGHPERALDVARDSDVARLDAAARIELAIVVSGARRDLGQADAAVLTLQAAALGGGQVEPWTARLWYAYAEALLASGQVSQAQSWFSSAATIDEEGHTDADERAEELASVLSNAETTSPGQVPDARARRANAAQGQDGAAPDVGVGLD